MEYPGDHLFDPDADAADTFAQSIVVEDAVEIDGIVVGERAAQITGNILQEFATLVGGSGLRLPNRAQGTLDLRRQHHKGAASSGVAMLHAVQVAEATGELPLPGGRQDAGKNLFRLAGLGFARFPPADDGVEVRLAVVVEEGIQLETRRHHDVERTQVFVFEDDLGRQHLRDLPPSEHPRFQPRVFVATKPVDGFHYGEERIEEHVVDTARAQPRALALHAQDPPAIPDISAADLEVGIVNGAIGDDFQSEGRRIRKTREPQFIGCQSGNTRPGNAERISVQFDGATIVT